MSIISLMGNEDSDDEPEIDELDIIIHPNLDRYVQLPSTPLPAVPVTPYFDDDNNESVASPNLPGYASLETKWPLELFHTIF